MRYVSLLAVALTLCASGLTHAGTYGRQSSGGGGGTPVAGTGISVDSSTPSAPVITNTAPATSDQVYQQPNSASSPKTIGEIHFAYTDNTAGAEYSSARFGFLNNGTQLNVPLEQSNLTGASATTTGASDSTPTVALPPTTDHFRITLGDNVTQLTITGLDDSKDLVYRACSANLVNGAGAGVIIRPNGHVGDAPLNGYYFSNPGGSHPFTPAQQNGFMFMDGEASPGNVGTTCAEFHFVPGIARSYFVNMETSTGASGLVEHYLGLSTNYTATMTSAVFFGPMNAGTVIDWIRPRATRN